MEQAKVTNYFRTRKGPDSIHASKRQKLNFPNDSVHLSEPKEKLSVVDVPETPKVVGPKKTTRKKNASRQAKKGKDSKSKDIRLLLRTPSDVVTEQPAEDGFSDRTVLPTAACDDHEGSSPATPAKRPIRDETTVNQKRSRKVARKDMLLEIAGDEFQTPEKGFDFSKYMKGESGGSSVRRKLVLKRRVSEEKDLPVFQLNPKESPEIKVANQKKAATANPDTSASGRSEDETKPTRAAESGPAFLSDVKAVNKSPETSKAQAQVAKIAADKRTEQREKVSHAATKPKKVTEKVEKNATQEKTDKDKTLKVEQSATQKKIDKEKDKILKLDSKTVRKKLEKSGNLAELQKRLSKFSDSAAKVQKAKDNRAKTTERTLKTPAYERYQALAQPGPPTLTLPYHYKLLGEMFNSVDTVLGILGKRFETCTFAKLKASVQNLLKRQFEEKNLGQIKTVYPTALKFRQEKNVPTFGKKVTGYQLTVEPDLSDLTDESEQKPEKELVPMTAANMLQRKKIFQNLLINIVKSHHKKFLASLDKPLSVPDDKITRWHPKFRVDEVPPVEPAELPQPPEVDKIFKATDALKVVRNKLTPRAVKALEAVSSESEKNQPTSDKPRTEAANRAPKKETVNQPSATKGVDMSLLARIRAKEAAKQEALMMRSPEQDKKVAMLERLPEVARLVRSHFISLRKDCLSFDDVIFKVSNGCKTAMGESQAEEHLKLLVETFPELWTVVPVRKTSYLKWTNKKPDITYITEKIEKRMKENKC